MSEFAPVIYVDLIKMEPMTSEQYFDRYRGFLDTDVRYNRYLMRFQPWRIVIKSGDNFEPLFKGTERWKHERDALHAIDLAFGPGANVFLRRHEKGNVRLRQAA